MVARTRLSALFAVLALGVAAGLAAQAEPVSDLASARQARTGEKWAASESLGTRALRDFEVTKAPDSLAMADALELIAYARWQRVGYADGTGYVAAARSLGIRERRLGGDDLLVADANALLARFLQGTGRADSAMLLVRRALEIRSQKLASYDTLIADTWDQLALVQRDRRDFRPALASWSRAIQVRRAAHGPEHPEIARLLAQTAVPLMELGEFNRARQALDESLAMFARTSGADAADRWIPLNILADLEGRSGNMARNLDLLQEALRIVRLNYGDDSREALTLRANIAVALANLGDSEGSFAFQRELLPLVEAQYGPASPRALQIRLGMALNARQLRDTVTATRQLLALESYALSNGGKPEWLLSSSLGQLAEILYWQKRDREALELNARATRIELASRQPSADNLALDTQVRIQILCATGDTAALDSALRDMKNVAASYFKRGTGPHVGSAHWGAQGARRLGRLGEAWDLALEAEQVSRERLRLNLRTFPDRRALLFARRDDRYLELVLDLARDRDPAHVRTAWDRLVRHRGAVRAEIARRSPPPELASDTVVTRALRRRMDTQLRLAQLTAGSGAARDSAARLRLTAARAEADDAEQMYAKVLADRGGKSDSSDAGLSEVQSRLKPGEALVGFYALGTMLDRNRYADAPEGTTIAFVARGGSDAVQLVDFGGTRELGAAVAAWSERLAVSPGPSAKAGDPAERECRRLGKAARAATWDKLAKHLSGVTDVYLVADGPVQGMAWQALPEGDSRYLVEAGPRLHLLNAERELIEPALPAPSGSLLAVGAPDFDLAGTPASAQFAAVVRSVPDPCAAEAGGRLSPLPGSGKEAEAVGHAWSTAGDRTATVLLGAAATEEAFKRGASGRTILHLATHGVVAGDLCRAGSPGVRGIGAAEPAAINVPASVSPARPATAVPRAPSPWMPRRVWIALAGANNSRMHTADENEGLLTAEEVLTLDLEGTDWVVLSACHSGAAEGWTHEGTLGMRRAFDLAGVRTVVASQWAVEDAATREWMQALYAARGVGARVAATALEAASRNVLAARRKAGRSTHPFYWAAFTATGE